MRSIKRHVVTLSCFAILALASPLAAETTVRVIDLNIGAGTHSLGSNICKWCPNEGCVLPNDSAIVGLRRLFGREAVKGLQTADQVVIAMQEVDVHTPRNHDWNMPVYFRNRLMKYTGQHWYEAFLPAINYPDGGRYGIALLANTEFYKKVEHRYAWDTSKELVSDYPRRVRKLLGTAGYRRLNRVHLEGQLVVGLLYPPAGIPIPCAVLTGLLFVQCQAADFVSTACLCDVHPTGATGVTQIPEEQELSQIDLHFEATIKVRSSNVRHNRLVNPGSSSLPSNGIFANDHNRLNGKIEGTGHSRRQEADQYDQNSRLPTQCWRHCTPPSVCRTRACSLASVNPLQNRASARSRIGCCFSTGPV